MKTFNALSEEVTQKQLNDVEKFADRILAKFNVDIEFTRHFADRMNDDRNKPAVSVAELQQIFKKIARKKAKDIKQNPDSEAVIKDIQKDLNLPVVIRYNRNKEEFEVTTKTIMRKKDFKTTSKVITTEAKKMKDDPCWKDYEMVGTKKKNGKEVPNCVPKEDVSLESTKEYGKSQAAIARKRQQAAMRPGEMDKLKRLKDMLKNANNKVGVVKKESVDEAVQDWTVTVTKPVNKLKKGAAQSVKARSAFEAINKAVKLWGDPALKSAPVSSFSVTKESVEEAKEPSLKSTDYPKGTSQSAQAFKDKFAKKKKVPALKSTDYPKGTSMSATAWKKKNESVEEARQMKDPKKDTMVTKSGKTIVIDKSKESEYLKKGWTLAENETVEESKNFFKFRESLNEKYQLYHATFSNAVQTAEKQAEKQGYEVDQDDWFNKIATGPKKPSEGKTNSYIIKLWKNDKPTKKTLSIQVFNMGKKYELNMYIS